MVDNVYSEEANKYVIRKRKIIMIIDKLRIELSHSRFGILY